MNHSLFLSGLAGCAALSASLAAYAAPMTLAELERAAAVSSTQRQVNDADTAAQQSQVAAAKAQTGARIFGGSSLGNVREAVTEQTAREYRRIQADIGVRWPLLGAREAQKRNVSDAESALAAAQARTAVGSRQTLRQLRTAYVAYVRSEERRTIAESFLASRREAEAQVQRRSRAGMVLKAESLDTTALFDEAQAERNRHQAARDTALRELRRLTASPAALPADEPPAWQTGCFQREPLIEAGAQGGEEALAQAELDAARRRQQHNKYYGMEAGVQLAQSASRDLPGLSGRNTSVSFDVSMPLQWRDARDAREAQMQKEIDRTQGLVQLAREQLASGVDRALQERGLRIDEADAQAKRRAAAQETLRVEQLRLGAFDGDGYAKLLSARSALYQASLQLSTAWERRELADVALLAYTDGCQSGRSESVPRMERSSLALISGAGGNALSAAAATGPSAVATSARSASLRTDSTTSTDAAPPPASPGGFGFFAWKGQALVDAPERLDRLPQGTTRILASFSAAQLQALQRPAAAARMERFLAAAARRGVAIELLLGEPTWVFPAGRQQLVALVRGASQFRFAALNLDLERSQLPASEHPAWAANVVDTLQAVQAVSPWPMALTTHPRDLRDTEFLRAIADAGVQEVVPMIFVARPERAAEIAAELMRLAPNLRLAVAQSIEAQLPEGESTARLGQVGARQGWARLQQSLSGQPAFSGVLVQSLEDFEKARP